MSCGGGDDEAFRCPRTRRGGRGEGITHDHNRRPTATDTHHDGHQGADETTRPTRLVRFARHYLLMIVAMYAGMLVLDPVYDAVATHAGYADPWAELPVLSALVMAGNMTVPMVLLMLRHRRGSRAILDMVVAMFAPTLAATALYVLGALPADQVMTVRTSACSRPCSS